MNAAYLIPALPLAGFAVLVLFGRRLGEPGAGWLATTAIGGSFLASLVTFVSLVGREGEARSVTKGIFTWITAGSFTVDAALLVDPLSITMCLFVTGVGTLIHLYSIGYMHGDERYHRFFIYLNLFAFSMLMLVLGDNMLLTFLGWEGVGACSYLLISFWFERESAAVAGKKAFVTNRVGDFGFMCAMFLVFTATGSLTYGEVFAHGHIASVTAGAIGLLLLLGAAGKSAQLPLYVWLPDAMEGPTPVSALIHAATMVTAGVYLLARMNPVLHAAPASVMTLIAVIGVLTALFAATVACAQDDIKRVLAYSTISQLGFMFLAVGSGAYVAAIFHMVTHAFFKALLFLGSGSVIHGLHEEQDMKRMGGLRKFMPVTAATFIVGWLAIAGVPPFAGFWSKDEILLAAWDKSPVLWGLGLVTALLTAYYMTRQVILVFFGEERWRTPADAVEPDTDETTQPGHSAREPHESPWTMTMPLVVLAVLSVVAGALNLPFADADFLGEWLAPVFGDHHAAVGSSTKLTLAIVAAVASLLGIFLARALWLRRSERPELEPAVLKRAWGIDALYATLFGTGGGLVAAGSAAFDKQVIDGAVNGTGNAVRVGGGHLRRLQTGYVRNYALGIAAGTVGILAWALVRAGA
ncbi:MAG TPA: NADH-quinone oxidoreductase subunit L [Acidimicrobiales bacterium]|nr:NADH-quinone oxidoreductase subunit L [Acidimicrobiales bacterium]